MKKDFLGLLVMVTSFVIHYLCTGIPNFLYIVNICTLKQLFFYTLNFVL